MHKWLLVSAVSVSLVLSTGVAAASPLPAGKGPYASCIQAGVTKAPKPLTAAKKKAIKRACRQSPAPSTIPTVNSAGVMTALPSNFPKSPTAQDITSLGLTRDSKVAPDLRLPQPSGTPLVVPVLAEKITPVRVLGTTTEQVESGDGWIDIRVVWVEWDVEGGQGALTYRGADSVGGKQSIQSVPLTTNGTVRILQALPVSTGNQLSHGMQYKMTGAVVPDYGQTSVPSSLSQDWNLRSQRALDVTGNGANVSKHGAWNPWWARADGTRTDDVYVVLDSSGNMTGNY